MLQQNQIIFETQFSNLSIQDFSREQATQVLKSLFCGPINYHTENTADGYIDPIINNTENNTDGYIDSIINDLETCNKLNQNTINHLKDNILKYASEKGYTEDENASNYDKNTAYVIHQLKESNLLENMLGDVLKSDLNDAAHLIQNLKENTSLSIEQTLPDIFRSTSESESYTVPLIQFSTQPSLTEIIQDQQSLLQHNGEEYYVHFPQSAQDSQQTLREVQRRLSQPLHQLFQNRYQNLQNQPIYQSISMQPGNTAQFQRHYQKLNWLNQVLQLLNQTIQSNPQNASQINALFHRTKQLLQEIQQFLNRLGWHNVFNIAQQPQSNPHFHHRLHSPLTPRLLTQLEQRFRNNPQQHPTRPYLRSQYTTSTIRATARGMGVFLDNRVQQESSQLRQSLQNSKQALGNLIANIHNCYRDYQNTLPYRQFNATQNLRALYNIPHISSTSISPHTQATFESIEEDIHASKIACVNDFLIALRDTESQNVSLLQGIDSNTIDVINRSAHDGFIGIAETLLNAGGVKTPDSLTETGFLNQDTFPRVMFHPKAGGAENLHEILKCLSKNGFIDAGKLTGFLNEMALNIDNFILALEVLEESNCLNYPVMNALIELVDPTQADQQNAYFVIDFAMSNVHSTYQLLGNPETAARNMLALCKYHEIFARLSMSTFSMTNDESIQLLVRNQALFDECIQLCDHQISHHSPEEIARYIDQYVQKKAAEMSSSDTSDEDEEMNMSDLV